MVSTYLIISTIVAIIAIALGGAYVSGALDPVIEALGIWFFKAKAEAEAKKLQAQGLKEGEDFVKGDLAGSKQASEVQEQFGDVGDSIGDLTKGF